MLMYRHSHLWDSTFSGSFVSIPENANDGFYQGETFVTCKDKVTQPSSPQTHAAELISIVTMNFSSNSVRSDHRLTYASVKVALLSHD